jgi:hypothetical protein
VQRLERRREGEEVSYALDNICNPAGLVVVGDGQLLHAGWLHPHLACNSLGCLGNKLSIRPARCSLKLDCAGDYFPA